MWKFTQEIVETSTNLHLCCDICATVCTCADCQLFTDSDNDLSGAHNRIPTQTCALSANPIVQTEIKKQLLSYRNALFLKSSPESALVGHEVCTGLTMKTIEAIVDGYFSIKTDLLNLGITSLDYCTTKYWISSTSIHNNNIIVTKVI